MRSIIIGGVEEVRDGGGGGADGGGDLGLHGLGKGGFAGFGGRGQGGRPLPEEVILIGGDAGGLEGGV